MFPTILAILVTALAGGDGPAKTDAQLLVDTIESLQQPVEDFQCEFEGTSRFHGKAAEGQSSARTAWTIRTAGSSSGRAAETLEVTCCIGAER